MRKSILFLALVVSMAVSAATTVGVDNQKIVLNRDGQITVLAPNGQDESYYWVSLSPDGSQILYSTAHHGTCVCDLQGRVLRSLGRLNAPKWMDNENVSGMVEHYSEFEHDVVDHIDYYGQNLQTLKKRALTKAETKEFIRKEEEHKKQLRIENEARAAGFRGVMTAGLSGLKIYVNAGHGGHDPNDRSCWTIPVPETWTNPNGYWESNSNLVKALALRDMLEAAGATVIMSRTTNKSGIRDQQYYSPSSPEYAELVNGDDRDLSAIAEEANANHVDHFLSIHSNALNQQTNYLLLLYSESPNSASVQQTDIAMARNSGNIQIQNLLTCWTSPSPLLRGDNTFLGYYLGVLYPLTVPGFLSEGSFHDYAPETHRLCNADYCKLEALRFFQHFHTYFGRELPQTATISGYVKSANEKVDVLNQPNFYYTPGTDDQWLPLNGAKVVLMDENFNRLDSVITDNWYNGVFAFYDLQPGTYHVEATLENYKKVVETAIVSATDIVGLRMFLKNTHMDVPDYEDPEQDAGTLPLEEYSFETKGNPVSGGTATYKRIAYKAGKVATLQSDGIILRDWNFMVLDTLPLPAGKTLADICDIAFAADGYLVAGVHEDNTTKFYAYDDDFANPTQYYADGETQTDCPSIAVKGSLWKNQVAWDFTSKLVVTPLTGSEALFYDQLDLTPAFFRYAHHSYMVRPVPAAQGLGFCVYDITNGFATMLPVSDTVSVNTVATNGAAIAYVDGYTIHIGILATNAQGASAEYTTFNSIVTPVANIYAGEVSYDETANVFRFRLNEEATSVSISIEKDGETKANENLGAMSKGFHEVANPFGNQGFDGFSITASARSVGYPVKVSNDDPIFQFYVPRGMTVDRTPSSPYFGRIYVSEAQGGQISEGSPAVARKTTQGIYTLTSDFVDITNQGATAWNGNVAWGETTNTNYQFGPANLGVAPSGMVYVPSSVISSSGIYIMDPAHPDSTFQPVFTGKRNKENGTIKNSGVLVTDPVMSCIVLGEGPDETLYTMSRNCSGTVYCNIYQYNIGQADSLPWGVAPSATIFDDATTNYYENGCGEIAYDGHGGFFMSQYRYSSATAKPALAHFTNGVMDYNCGGEISTCNRGGMAVSVDGSLLAIARETGVVAVYDVEYDANNVPTLTEKYVIEWGKSGWAIACEFDAAGNLYVISSSIERLMVFSLPKLVNSYTTRVPYKKQDVGFKNIGGQDDTVRKVVRDGQVLIIKGDKTYNVLGAEL